MTVAHTRTQASHYTPQHQFERKIINTSGHTEEPADSTCLLLNDFVPYPSLDTPTCDTHVNSVACQDLKARGLSGVNITP